MCDTVNRRNEGEDRDGDTPISTYKIYRQLEIEIFYNCRNKIKYNLEI